MLFFNIHNIFKFSIKGEIPKEFEKFFVKELGYFQSEEIPVDLEIELKHKLNFDKQKDKVLTPHGMTANLGKAKITSEEIDRLKASIKKLKVSWNVAEKKGKSVKFYKKIS